MPYREAEFVLNKIWHDLVLLKSNHCQSLMGTVSETDADIVLLLDRCLDDDGDTEEVNSEFVSSLKL